uniref:TraB domain-containing protein n=1 Tax=Strongyloides papillosus TaxID=174720 RepID=A0A0N5C657_STREA
MENNNINIQQSSIEIQEIPMYSKDEAYINNCKNNISIKKFGLKKKPIENYIQPPSSFTLTFDEIPIKFNKIFPANISEFYRKGKIILVGTRHFSNQSRNDVRDVIRSTIPDAIFVELCHSRINILNMNEEVIVDDILNPLELIFNCIKQEGLTKGLVSALLISYTNELMKKSKLCPGGEFRVAQEEGRKIKNSIFGFCDRNIEITLNRLYRQLTFWEKLKLLKDILYFNNDDERVKKLFDNTSNYINFDDFPLLSWEHFPSFKKIMVDERDQYMSTFLLEKYNKIFEEKAKVSIEEEKSMEAVNIVAVVGYGHISGIKNYFGKEYDLNDLNSISTSNEKKEPLKLGLQIFVIGGVLLITHYVFKRWM